MTVNARQRGKTVPSPLRDPLLPGRPCPASGSRGGL